MAGRVCVVGSANLDLVAQVPRLPSPGETLTGYDFFEAAGGKGLNQAVAAARAGADVVFVGAVGDDEAGRSLLRVMAADGLDTAHVVTLAATPTGRALIGLADDGANSIIVVPGANGRVGADAVLAAAEALRSADVVLLQHEVPEDGVRQALLLARHAGATTILNPAPARVIPADILALVDVLVPNEHEFALLGDVSAVRTIIVTEGERGSRVLDVIGERRVPAFRVDAIDTVAAGDAFCGALAAALASGLPVEAALIRATAAGALATTRIGAVPSLPTATEIDALIART